MLLTGFMPVSAQTMSERQAAKMDSMAIALFKDGNFKKSIELMNKWLADRLQTKGEQDSLYIQRTALSGHRQYRQSHQSLWQIQKRQRHALCLLSGQQSPLSERKGRLQGSPTFSQKGSRHLRAAPQTRLRYGHDSYSHGRGLPFQRHPSGCHPV